MTRIRSKPLPTDYQILNAIYERYYDEFAAHTNLPGAAARQSKVYVPIDCQAIADDLHVDADIVFGRLYYVLDRKHRFREADGTLTALFYLRFEGGDTHCVQFPLLASILAVMREERRTRHTATTIALVSLAVSIAVAVFSMMSE